MRVAGIMTALAVGIVLAGCSSAPRAKFPEVTFVWGCWVSKPYPDGRPTAFLRLLPNTPQRDAYVGDLHAVGDDSMTAIVHFTFAMDGSRASADFKGEHWTFTPIPNGPGPGGGYTHRAIFGREPDDHMGTAIIAAGKPDQISLTLMTPGDFAEFAGERDGCD